MSTVPPAVPSPPPAAPPPPPAEEIPTKIFLVSYPKIIFLYPTFLVALFAAIFLSVYDNSRPDVVEPAEVVERAEAVKRAHVTVSSVFLIVLTINLFVFSFDFPRTTSLTLFFFFTALICGGLLLYQYHPEWFGRLGHWLSQLHPEANSTFFIMFCVLLGFIYFAVLANVQFDYWEVRPNELLHHHGFLSNLERFSAPSLRIDKEINDVFEYMLLGSGRLILHPSNEPRAIVLENVLMIGRKEKQITKMLGALQVQIRTNQSAE